MKQLPSTKYSLRMSDWLNGLLISIGSTVIPALIALLGTGSFPTKTQLVAIGIGALSAGLTYIAKNFLKNDVAVAQKIIQEAEVKEKKMSMSLNR